MGHEKAVEPFSDIHAEHGKVIATLLHDPTVEGLDMALYLDGSGSMQEEYKYRKQGSLWSWLLGKPAPEPTNDVEPQAQWILEYLATKDRNGMLRAAYWACGTMGRDVEVIGELSGANVKQHKFKGPRVMGNRTNLLPALEDYMRYFGKMSREGARQGCAVFITDGQIHDAAEVMRYCARIAKEIVAGERPRVNFILVGVGKDVSEEQMEEICHHEYPGLGHMWCHRIAEEIGQVAELVAVLVDETMTVASGGTVYDDKGKVLKIYEGRLPAVLQFDIREGARSFTLEIAGKRYVQPIPDEDDDDDHH